MASRKEGHSIGAYRVIEQIGEGGMATVYKALQPSMDRYVAIKILPQHYARNTTFVERFIQEARTIASLEHQNILPVYDFGEENGITYMVMRYMEGGTLKDILEAGRLSYTDCVRIMNGLCAGLDYAHRQGIIHRDIKPANILIDHEGGVYLTDFGIAKILEGASNLTATGTTVGTPAYMAPEQSLGQQVDARTDIYAAGVILYEIVSGNVPYQADTPMAVALAHVHEPLPLPRERDPGIPIAVENVILKALAKQPEDRYQTATELAEALRAALQEAGTEQGQHTLPMLALQASEARATVPIDAEQFRSATVAMITQAGTVPSSKDRKGIPIWVWGAIVALLLVIGVVGVVALGLSPGGNSDGKASAENETDSSGGDSAGRSFDLTPPEGFVDTVDCGIIAGWTWDPDFPDEAIEVAIFDVDAQGEETQVAAAIADNPRQDLSLATGDNGEHGFEIIPPFELQDGETHIIRVYAVNPEEGFKDVALPPTANELTCGSTESSTASDVQILEDSFDDPAFDGSFNSELWTTDGSCNFQQTNGEMTLTRTQTADDEACGMVPRTGIVPPRGTELDFTEASWQISDDHVGGTVEGNISWVANFPGGSWYVLCGIITGSPNDLTFLFEVVDDRSGGRQFAETIPGLDHNTYYATRLEVDPETLTFTCYADGDKVGSYTPDNVEELQESFFEIRLNTYSIEQASATVRVDDAHVGVR